MDWRPVLNGDQLRTLGLEYIVGFLTFLNANYGFVNFFGCEIS